MILIPKRIHQNGKFSEHTRLETTSLKTGRRYMVTESSGKMFVCCDGKHLLAEQLTDGALLVEGVNDEGTA